MSPFATLGRCYARSADFEYGTMRGLPCHLARFLAFPLFS
jgi:hypothetical protein